MDDRHSYITRLPLEIICHILKQLEGHEIALCRLVSRHFKESIENSVLLQYAIKLAICGYEDGLPMVGPLSATSERLQRLQAHIDAWRHLDWVEQRIKLPHGQMYDLVGGVYASVENANPFSLNVVELPSSIRRTPLRLWSFADVGFFINDFAIDPEQDLLVLVELREEGPRRRQPYIHLRTLSGNAPHPHASVSILATNLRAAISSTGQSQVQVAGNKVGFMWDEREAEVFQVWCWDSGSLIWARSLDPGAPSFCFLDENTVLLPYFDGQINGGGGAIVVYRLPSSDTLNGHLGLHVAEKTKLIATFELPALMMGVGSTVYIHNNASMVHSNPGNPRPFHIPPHRRVVKIEWVTFGRNERHGPDGINGLTIQSPVFGRIHNIYVHSDIFRRDPNFYPEAPIPWHRWGPRNTRMLPHSSSKNFHSRSIFGVRHVQLLGASLVEVHDFTEAQSAWEDQYLRPNNENVVESIMVDRSSPEELEGAHMYQDGVVRTSLPYLHLFRNLESTIRGRRARGIMCDDEHIILLQGRSLGAEGHDEVEDEEVIILTL